MQYRTRGIILKRKKYGEADRLLTIYTEKKGKITAIAKGSRKILSKLGGHLELFYLSDFIVIEGKNIDTIIGAEIIEVFPDLRKDSDKTRQAYYFAELIDQLIREEETSREIFNLLLKCLKYLDKDNNSLLLVFFELGLLLLLGHRPEIKVCVKCRKKLKPKNNYFSDLFGGILCENCHKFDISSQVISTEAIKILRLLSQDNISIINKIKIADNLRKDLEQILLRFIQGIAEKEMKTSRFLK